MDFCGVSITKSFGFSAYQTEQFLIALQDESIKLIINDHEYSNIKISFDQYQPNLKVQKNDNLI